MILREIPRHVIESFYLLPASTPTHFSTRSGYFWRWIIEDLACDFE